ncbi:hypothetical protein O3M35_007139 [Rhynocoris fuscipes]|uniref:Uncharacterized protein n=1 Tax=Rhynocoris fuscipes TaxID=488301 RepID=A0AAW1DAX7_9HEMI
MNSHSKGRIAIIGSGAMGRSWAMMYASANYQVNLYDIDADKVVNAKYEIKMQLEDLEKRKLLRGNRAARDQNSLIGVTRCLSECIRSATYVQECIVENLKEKKRLFSEIDRIIDDHTIVTSSTSTFQPSNLFSDLKHKKNYIITHPVDPYVIPLVEIVPGYWTDVQTINKTKEMLEEIGQCPVIINKEKIGFAATRIQFAMIGECWHLLNEGVISIEDIDKVISEGVAMKFAMLGPFSTIHLSAFGIEDYLNKYRPALVSLSQTFQPAPRFEGELTEQIVDYLNKRMPVDNLVNYRNDKNRCLIELWKLKKTINAEKKKESKRMRSSIGGRNMRASI